MNKRNLDLGYTVDKCKDAIAACEALIHTSGERRHWENKIKLWETQLAYAEKRNG